MIKNLLSAAAIVLLGAGVATAEPVRFDVAADCWVRSNNEGWKDGNSYKLEFHKVGTKAEGAITEITGEFYALLGFDYELPAGKKVSKATLNFVTERWKGSATSVRGYKHDFPQNSTYSAEKEYIEAAMQQEPLYKGDLAGQWNKAITDGISEDKQNVSAWTNTIDVTNYVKTVAGSRVNFILSLDDAEEIHVIDQNCIFAGEVADKTDGLPAFATAADLVPFLEVEFVEDAARSEVSLTPVMDTEVRSNDADANKNRSTQDQMEIKNVENAESFYGLMEFALPSEIFDTQNYELNRVELRLFFKMNKGDRAMNLHAYGETVDAGSNYVNAQTFIDDALTAEPIAEFSANGQGGKACWDKGIRDEYLTAEAWTNRIDLTDYVQSLIGSGARAVADTHVSFVLSKKNYHKEAMRISSAEATDITANADEHPDVVFAANDIKPMLTVSYSKKKTGITDITVADENAPAEYYNLSGMRVNGENLTPGIYVKRQGGKATKVYVK